MSWKFNIWVELRTCLVRLCVSCTRYRRQCASSSTEAYNCLSSSRQIWCCYFKKCIYSLDRRMILWYKVYDPYGYNRFYSIVLPTVSLQCCRFLLRRYLRHIFVLPGKRHIFCRNVDIWGGLVSYVYLNVNSNEPSIARSFITMEVQWEWTGGLH